MKELEEKACRRNNKKDVQTINQIIELAKSLLAEPDDIEESAVGEDDAEANACKPKPKKEGEAEEPKQKVNPEEKARLLELIQKLNGENPHED